MDSFLLTSEYQEVYRLIPLFFYQRANALTHQASTEYPTVDDFVDDYEMTESTWDNFVGFAYRELGSRTDTTSFVWNPAWTSPVKKELKARMAKHLYGNTGYYRVWLSDDLAVEKARNALHSSDPLTYK